MRRDASVRARRVRTRPPTPTAPMGGFVCDQAGVLRSRRVQPPIAGDIPLDDTVSTDPTGPVGLVGRLHDAAAAPRSERHIGASNDSNESVAVTSRAGRPLGAASRARPNGGVATHQRAATISNRARIDSVSAPDASKRLSRTRAFNPSRYPAQRSPRESRSRSEPANP